MDYRNQESDEEEEQQPQGNQEPWVRIQQHTFTNWINDKLAVLDLKVDNLRKDFQDGVLLCRLMEVLKRRGIGKVKDKAKLNHYERAGNLQLAFNAMREDGVRLVNIGKNMGFDEIGQPAMIRYRDGMRLASL